MARRTSKPAKGRRETKARSKMPTAVAETEIVEEGAGMGVGDGMTIATTLILLAAVLLTDYLLGAHYDAGMFF